MARYIVRRSGAAHTWMVWDRDNRAPVKVDGKLLAHFTAEQAELAFSALTGQPPRSRLRSEIPINSEWQVTFAAASTALTEVDAKLLARELVKRGHQVFAKTVEGVFQPGWWGQIRCLHGSESRSEVSKNSTSTL
jgi:hypothetical protein